VGPPRADAVVAVLGAGWRGGSLAHRRGAGALRRREAVDGRPSLPGSVPQAGRGGPSRAHRQRRASPPGAVLRGRSAPRERLDDVRAAGEARLPGRTDGARRAGEGTRRGPPPATVASRRGGERSGARAGGSRDPEGRRRHRARAMGRARPRGRRLAHRDRLRAGTHAVRAHPRDRRRGGLGDRRRPCSRRRRSGNRPRLLQSGAVRRDVGFRQPERCPAVRPHVGVDRGRRRRGAPPGRRRVPSGRAGDRKRSARALRRKSQAVRPRLPRLRSQLRQRTKVPRLRALSRPRRRRDRRGGNGGGGHRGVAVAIDRADRDRSRSRRRSDRRSRARSILIRKDLHRRQRPRAMRSRSSAIESAVPRREGAFSSSLATT
jgi:hypothetical protein